MPNFTGDSFSNKRKGNRRSGILPIATVLVIILLILLSLMVISSDKAITGWERILVVICSYLVIIPGIFILLRRRNPIIYARFLMFGLLMMVVMILILSEPDFHPPLHLLIAGSLWALPLSLLILYRGVGLWAITALDLLLLGAFVPALPVFHFPSFLLLMCVPLAILTWERGWQGGLGGFIPLFWGLVDTRFTYYQDAGLFLLIWAPILGGASSALGLLVGDYRRLRKIIERLQICQQLNRDILGKESLREGMRTMLNHILGNIPCDRYSLKVVGDEANTFSLVSSPPPFSPSEEIGTNRWNILQQSFEIVDVRAEVILQRDHGFDLEEEELFNLIIQEVMPAMEKLLYLDRAVDMAISDSLTTLANRAYFLYWLREDINRSNRYKTPLSLLLIDIDGFKKYNDLYGHHAGDIVLRKIGEKLKSLIRKSDIAARYGGDEFVILFPHATVDEASKVSERIRENIRNMRIAIGEGEFMTISGGLTMLKFGEAPEEFLKRADMLLYRAKEKGGNRIEVG